MKKPLTDHVSECSECAAEETDAARVAEVEEILRTSEPASDSTLLARTMLSARPLLEAHAQRRYRRRVAAAVAAGLVPLPLIAAYSSWLLGLLHRGLASLFPGGVADVVVGGYAVCLLLVISLTYAAIPILAERQSPLPAGRRVAA